MQAIETVTATPALHTRDLGGKATTAEVTQAVCRQLAAAAQGLPPFGLSLSMANIRSSSTS